MNLGGLHEIAELQQKVTRLESALAAEKKAREEDKLRIAQLEEMLREVGRMGERIAHDDQRAWRARHIGKGFKNFSDSALTSTPSALSEVLRAARKFYDATPETGWRNMGPLWKPMAELCQAVRKYEEEK